MAGSLLVFLLNINLSIDFTGGMNVRVATTLSDNFASNATQYFVDAWLSDISVQTKVEESYTDISIKTRNSDDEQITKISEWIQTFLIESNYIADADGIIQSSVTGPSVWAYMQSAALRAIVIGIIFMVIYMLFSFAWIRKTISPSILATVTVITMLFDIAIPSGAYWLLMMINPTVQVDTVFIIAILTIMWYSINDTIIIFDRIRENADKSSRENEKWVVYAKIFENSLRQTMRRSIWTSLSTLLVIAAMYAFGSGVIQLFAFTTWVGVIAGTFSSIFIAAPLAYIMLGKFKKEQNKF